MRIIMFNQIQKNISYREDIIIDRRELIYAYGNKTLSALGKPTKA